MHLKVTGATRRPLFRGVTFELDDDDGPSVLTVMGPSGSGKTTLVKCLAGLEPFDAGMIALDGKTMVEWGMANWRAHVLYVPQRPPLLRMTGLEFWKQVTQEFASQRARSAEHGDPIEVADAWDIGHHLWHRPLAQLSGGEAQRIMLAIGVALNPAVLLLDEPTSALDATSTQRVEDTLRTRSCIWITHSKEQAARVGACALDLAACRVDAGPAALVDVEVPPSDTSE
ncbi:hypothetical protein AMAG_08059 [Allomyces macrogynus ATCC 38327]|uniref:ABC transporter domain-containing protein n=1 Tax=Allomyces macrogynus (strain ATCC 38327) TaxID=578462 RepID=A0A0L0SK62_ALLM3|nr:hypothetical protein AMAG_08059 [Allomyces macrogynus ATCC 38327]|eukprot:KNE62881.1 hypothetical protein AMAG_08059 [Allomyces macrogynus ATCC 38327]